MVIPNKFVKITLILIAISLWFGLPAGGATQTTPTAPTCVTRIGTSNSGLQFYVDGVPYTQPVSMVWTTGSQHVLAVTVLSQSGTLTNSQYTFLQWQWSLGIFTQNLITITADPSITQYTAIFQGAYGLNLVFSCGPQLVCSAPPGLIYMNGATVTQSGLTYWSPGSSVILQAMANPGWVFAGWSAESNLVIQGFQATMTLNQPATVTAFFQVARQIDFATSPPGLSVLLDRATVPTPAALEWGWDSVHGLGPVSPQLDQYGHPWVFSSWSDNGAAYHSYTVAESATPDTVTATYAPGVPVCVFSSPRGLSLTVDGRSNWPSTCFTWGVGEVHQLAAPAEQTDSQNRVWGFANWSNGGAATQSFTVPASGVPLGLELVAAYTPVGHLTVTSNLAGIGITVNGQSCGLPCDVKQPVGTQLTVSAPASVPAGQGSRQDLLGWSNGTGPGNLVVTLGENPIAVSANYHLMNYLASSSAPAGAVSWTLNPASPDGYYDSLASVGVAVTPLAGYRFLYWTGDLTGTSPSGTVAMSQPRAVQAVLEKVPYVAPGAVVNGAGITPQAGVAPGSILSIFGVNLAAQTVTGPASPMAQTLGGLTVAVSGRLLPLFFVSPGQINAQLPADMALGDTVVTISAEGEPDATAKFTIVADAPGLFAQTVAGQPYALAFHADGTLITPSAPASRGEVVTVYGTGFGPTGVPRPMGLAVPASPPMVATDPVAAQLGTAALEVQQTFAVPGMVGVDAIQFVIGDGVASGTNAPLTVTIGGQASNALPLPVE